MDARAGLIDAYGVLGVDAGASQAALKAAHRRLVRRHHPDVVPPAERAAATRRVQEINIAYGLVRDEASRAAYDRLLGARRREQAVATADADLARRWEALLEQAGRWAGAWWARNRRGIERSAVRGALAARRAGLVVVGRLLWLAYCLLGALVGTAVGIAASEMALGAVGALSPVAGLLAGWAVGADQGRRRRHRLAGLPPPRRAPVIAPLVAVVALVLALAVDARLL